MNILIPIGPSSQTFGPPDYPFPQPLIEINHEPLIQHVINSLGSLQDITKIIFTLPKEMETNFYLSSTLRLVCEHTTAFVITENPTAGSACSCLLAIDHLNHSEPLLIWNSNLVWHNSLSNFIAGLRAYDGGFMTFGSVHPRWSYARTEGRRVIQTAEKNPISRNAIAGAYYYSSATLFIDGAYEMLLKDDHVNGRFYTSQTYNQLILKGKNISSQPVGLDDFSLIHDIESLNRFKNKLQKGLL